MNKNIFINNSNILIIKLVNIAKSSANKNGLKKLNPICKPVSIKVTIIRIITKNIKNFLFFNNIPLSGLPFCG